MWALGPVLTAGVNADYDPYYDKVVLLLRANGANGSTNVVDESPHGHTVAVAGNATVSTAQSVTGGASYALDGTGDYLSMAYNASCFDFPAGTDFTIEMWFYATSDITDRTLMSCYVNGTTGWCLVTDPNARPYFNCTGDGIDVQSSVPITTGRWYHIAVCREGTSLRMYLDGELVGAGTDAQNATSSAAYLWVGRLSDSLTTYDWQGYIDNVRVTKGFARYGFPLVSPAPTSLGATDCAVLNFDGADAATTTTDLANKTWTFYGNAQLDDAQSRYGNTSLLLDGNGDYLQREISSGFPAANSNYSVSLWVRSNANNQNAGFVFWGTASANNCTGVSIASNGTLLRQYWWSNDLDYTLPTDSLNDGHWHHILATFDGTVRKTWLDGRVVAADKPINHNVTGESTVLIGRTNPASSDYFNGWIDAVQVTSSVLSLKAFDPAAIKYAINSERYAKYDLMRINADQDWVGPICGPDGFNARFYRAGDATISATQSRTGGMAFYFDGTGDRMHLPVVPEKWAFGTDDFTIEGWFYFTATPSNNSYTLVGAYDDISNPKRGITLQYRTDTSNRFVVGFGDAQPLSAPFTVSTNTWYHVAASRTGGRLNLHVNGICIGSVADTTNFTEGVLNLTLGALYAASSWIQHFTGYMDAIRITRGAGRYARPLPTLQPTIESHADVLVCDFEGSNGATAYTDSNGRRWTFNGNAQLSNTQTKFGSTSLALDGTGDYLTAAGHAPLAFGTGDFAVEWWMYKSANGSANYDTLIDTSGNGNATGGWFIEASATRGVLLSRESAIRVQYNVSPNDSTWHHWCVMRRNGQLYILLDGVQVATAADSATYAAAQLNIGRNGSNTYFFNGYIDGLRVTKGIPRFLEYRQGPYAPWPASYDRYIDSVVSHIRGHGTSGAAVIVDETGRTWTRTGVTTATTNARFRGSSLFFDSAASSKLTRTDSTFATGTGDFTWEAWVYSGTTGAWSRLIETAVYNGATPGWHLSFNGTDGSGARRLGFQLSKNGGGGTRLESDLAFPNATFAHVAFVRENNVGRLFVDGFPQSTTIDLSAENFTSDVVTLGSTVDNTNYFNGCINDIRLTKGVARYTPTMYMQAEPSALEVFDMSVLNCNGADNSTTLTDLRSANSWTCAGNACLKTAQAKYGSASLYFDGTGDWAWTAGNPRFDLLTYDFTIESWVYITSLASARSLWARRNGTTGASGWAAVVATNGAISMRALIGGVWQDGTLATAAGVITANNWHHISLNRRGNMFFFVVNGILRARYYNAGAMSDETNSKLMLGVNTENTLENAFLGYMDSFRMTVGRCRYGPPDHPLPRTKK